MEPVFGKSPFAFYFEFKNIFQKQINKCDKKFRILAGFLRNLHRSTLCFAVFFSRECTLNCLLEMPLRMEKNGLSKKEQISSIDYVSKRF